VKASRQSDSVTWWKMGRTAATLHGVDRALQMSADITSSGARLLFRSGALGERRPRTRPVTPRQAASTP